MSETIIEKNIVPAYCDDMIRYAITVNRRRSFPEVRDGLKIVQRRTIYDMFIQSATSKNKIKVSAITGDTQKLFHPHGDSSIYSALVSMATWFRRKVSLIAEQGNWGTVMGDEAAASRYIEAGLSDFCYDAIIGYLKDSDGIVDWIDNYTRTRKEPEYLPVKVPILLVNGTDGIGVGMAANLPTHNLLDVINETRAVIRDPNHNVVLVPDHCQECEIIDTDWRKISNTGRGKYKVRGKIKISEVNGYPIINIISLPNGVPTEKIISKIEKMIADKQLPMVKDIDDQSAKNVNIIMTLKKGADPNYVKQVLYSKTDVQISDTINFEAVNGVEPRRYNYTEYIRTFLDNFTMVKFRWYCNMLKKNMTRYHQLIAYIKIIESGEIDNIIKMVKKQTTIDENELMEYIIKKLKITDLQAKFILSTDIKKLSKGFLDRYKKEAEKLEKEQVTLRAAITDDGSIIMSEIDHELEEIAIKYGQPRTCKIITEAESNSIPSGIFRIVVTERNYLRKIPDTDKVGIIRKDNPKFILRVDNVENILLFDNKGRVYKLPVSKIPVTDRNGSGVDIRMIVKNLTADIIAVYYEPDIKKFIGGKRKHYLTIVTRDNLIKRMDLEDFSTINLSGLVYSKIRDNDEIVGVSIVPAGLDIIIYSKQKALRTGIDSIPLLKRNASGSKAMNIDTILEGISVMYPDVTSIVVVTENGKMNKFPISGLPQRDRAKGGINVIRLSNNDTIFSIFGVNEKDKIRVLTNEGPIEVPVSEIKSKSPVAAGEKMINLKTSTIIKCDVIY